MPGFIDRSEVGRLVDGVLVTRSDGALIGLLDRPIAERAIREADHADR